MNLGCIDRTRSCHGDERSRCARCIIPSYVSDPNIFERSSGRAVRVAVNTRHGALRSTTVADDFLIFSPVIIMHLTVHSYNIERDLLTWHNRGGEEIFCAEIFL